MKPQSPVDELVCQTIEFEVKKYAYAWLTDVQYDSDFDFLSMTTRHHLHCMVASMSRKVTVRAPATRWDALKELFVPKRWHKYVRINYRNLSAEAHALLDMAIPRDQRLRDKIRFAVHDATRYWNTKERDDE
jgi:hypothetical protein